MKRNQTLTLSHRMAQAVARFRQGEDGAMIIFTLFMFILILWLGGMSVDLMRFETTRAKLQGTLDRATLAAADLDQPVDGEAVVRDYFEKAGMIDFLKETVVDEGLNYRIVTASAEAEMPLFFYDIPRIFTENFKPGLSTLTVGGTSTAEERVTDVEVSLVLDVSSSMNSNGRITNLRPAAREFVTTVLGNNTGSSEGLLTISMVPYSAVVNPGLTVANHLNINRIHDYSSCVTFPDTTYSTTALNLDAWYDHVGHFDIGNNNDSDVEFDEPWCFTGNTNAIMPFSDNEGALHAAINNLSAFGNTAIDLGLKWGVGLLDPSTQSIATSMAGRSGTFVPAAANGRPYAHGTEDVLKVVVLMTDGANSQQWDMRERFRTGTSFVWFNMNGTTAKDLDDISSSNISVQYQGLGTPDNYYDDRFFWNNTSGVSYDQYYMNVGQFRNYPKGFANRDDYVIARQTGAIASTLGYANDFYYNRVVAPDNMILNAGWQEIFATWEVNWINNVLLREAYERGAIPYSSGNSGAPYYIYYDDYVDTEFSYSIDTEVAIGTEADARLDALCTQAKSQGIIIYAVAFEAEAAGEAALSKCASSESHYFDVQGANLTDAFSAIASDIRALKLTQ